jgi:hypothetical protein
VIRGQYPRAPLSRVNFSLRFNDLVPVLIFCELPVTRLPAKGFGFLPYRPAAQRIPFAVSDVEVLTSLHDDLDKEKVHLAVSQALSLWCTVAPVSFELAEARDFELATAGKQALLSIRFESDGLPNNDQVDATSGENPQPALSAPPALPSTPTTSSLSIGIASIFRLLYPVVSI